MAFKIIPVIDLKNGDVVHAVKGERDRYKPLTTLISASIELNDLCSVFINQYQFQTIYIADLDAITANNNQHGIIKSLLTAYPDLKIWLDSGLDLLTLENNQYQCTQILGTEMNFDRVQLRNLTKQCPDAVLSLDFSGSQFLGKPELLKHPQEWPDNIILMNLDKVGSQQGLNYERIQSIQSMLSRQQKLFIAGGIRNESDIEELQALGVDGALISTALHNLSINTAAAAKYR